MACPICKSNNFYTKNPTDDYEIYEFTYEKGQVRYEDDEAEADAPEMSKKPEIYCQRCAWHGKIDAV